MSTINPRRIEAAMSAAQQLRASLVAEDGTIAEDDRAMADTLDGATEVMELIDRIAEAAIADAQLVELARARAQRLEQRAARNRSLIARMMEALELKQLERPLVTASISYHAKPVVTGELPPEFMRTAPDLVRLNKALHAGTEVPNATLGNPEPRLSLRVR